MNLRWLKDTCDSETCCNFLLAQEIMDQNAHSKRLKCKYCYSTFPQRNNSQTSQHFHLPALFFRGFAGVKHSWNTVERQKVKDGYFVFQTFLYDCIKASKLSRPNGVQTPVGWKNVVWKWYCSKKKKINWAASKAGAFITLCNYQQHFEVRILWNNQHIVLKMLQNWMAAL